MMKQRPKFHPLTNNRGILSIDFLFAMTMSALLCLMMFAFTTTLSMIEIAQYVAFSTTRAHAAAHQDQARQVATATNKFKSFSLPANFPSLSVLFNNGWFELDQKSLDIRGGGQGSASSSGGLNFNEEYGTAGNIPQYGVRFRFNAKILKMNIPLLGEIADDDDFGTWVTGLMIREPTTEECTKSMAMSVRYQAIKRLDTQGRYQRAINGVQANGGHPNDRDYLPLEDNGC